MKAARALARQSVTGTSALRRVDLADASPDLLRDWKDLLVRVPSASPLHDPDWIREQFDGDSAARVIVYLLYRDGDLQGVAPVAIKTWPVKWQLGEVTVARVPFTRARLLGGGPHFPDDSAALTLLFEALASEQTRFDGLYADDVPVDSPFWTAAAGSAQGATAFRPYIPEPPSPRVLLRLRGEFEDYLGEFSPKHRQTLRRKVRKFESLSPEASGMVRFTRPDEVDAFLSQAVEISRKTYQWNLLGEGLRHTDVICKKLRFLAQQGCMRCYLLTSNGAPCAFVTGYQYGQRFFLDDMGYDPAWREYSPGAVLQFYIVEDLFAHNRPAVYDLGEYGPHKEEFANENVPQGKLFLARRRPYARIALAGHRLCVSTTSRATALLDRFGLKAKVKKLIRSWSAR